MPTTLSPLRTEPYLATETRTTPWDEAVAELRRGGTFWLATAHPDGRPHLAPVLAVWVDEVLHVATDPASRKGRNLAADTRAALSCNGEHLDLVVEGTARPVADRDALARVAAAYLEVYGWSVEVRDGSFHAEGAPTAGPGPFTVHGLLPRTAFGFPRDGDRPATRWRFT
ncbi:pyridoxamine 5'-phosphate oxidase family protein [Nitriliruptoraceae bacterium ZYF776]|nr:pyridoxamine 5'-phosphate oxidase family protein [Profundirhabdus halotolerans]